MLQTIITRIPRGLTDAFCGHCQLPSVVVLRCPFASALPFPRMLRRKRDGGYIERVSASWMFDVLSIDGVVSIVWMEQYGYRIAYRTPATKSVNTSHAQTPYVA